MTPWRRGTLMAMFELHPPTSPRRRRVRLLAVVVAATTVAAACTTNDSRPATVTMPEMNTTTTVDPSAGSPDQVAPQGPQEPLPVAWITQFGGAGDDSLRAAAGDDAQIVAVGATVGLDAPGAGGNDVLVAVVGSDGEMVSLRSAGSAGDDVATGVAADSTVVVCGSTSGDLGAISGGSEDAWCAALDENGALGQATQLGGPDSETVAGVGSASGTEVSYVAGALAGLLPGAQDSAGRGLGQGDALSMQVDPAGTPVWARQFGTAAPDAARTATGTDDGDGVLAGWTDGDLEGRSSGGRDSWISRFDPTGNQRWITQLGSAGTDELSAVTVTGEARRGTEQFVAAGVTDGDVDAEGPGLNAGENDVFVAAFGTDGRLLWIRQFGASGTETVGGVAADGSTVYVTGTTTSDEFGDLIPDGGDGGGSDGYLAALDTTTGDVSWVSRFGSAGDEDMTGLTTTEDGMLVASGTTTAQVGETPSAGGSDAFLIAFPLASLGGGAASSV